MVALLETRDVTRRLGGRSIVDAATMHVAAGEVVAVIGENGAGKSTLFRLLLGVERPDAGEVLLHGASASTGSLARHTAGVFQRPILFAGSVADNVAYGLRVRAIRRSERERRTAQALQWFGLSELSQRSVHALSGGEVQRVALARALVLEPDVLLLDEPGANLDITMRRTLRDDIERIARQHARSIILITHDASEALALADRLFVMHHGRIVQTGTPGDIVLRPGSPFVAAWTGAELLLHGVIAETDGDLCSVRLDDGLVLWAKWSAAERAQRGGRAIVAYRPEDILLVSGDALDSSAINRVPVTVAAMAPSGGLVRVQLRAGSGAVSLTALISQRSAERLGAAPQKQFVAHMKATALHAWQRDAWLER
jgi:tungstate transport system ATP-binding protein